MEKLLIHPGTPDDDNRDYLPERIKGSDIVVNENGNNSQPYPKRLREYHEDLTGCGIVDTWYEYVPSSYDPSRKVPLVLSMHGGMMTGWGQCIYTSWSMVAEKHGLIVAFPDASHKRVWRINWGSWAYDGSRDKETPPPEAGTEIPVEKNHDVNFALQLIHKMKEKYNIDDERIYMQGMSMGNMMTALFARTYGNILAGAAGSGCATFPSLLFDRDGNIQNQAGHLDIWQSRPELNNIPPEKDLALSVNKLNKYYWMKINDCDPLPQIRIVGENNLAFYRGSKADLTYLDIKNRDHGQSLDDAALVWEYMFSGTRRKADGTIVHEQTDLPRSGDAFSIAFADSCRNAWFNNKRIPMSSEARHWQKLKYHGLQGSQIVRGEYILAPLSFLAKVFGGEYVPSEDTLSAVIKLPDGRRLQFARGSIGCVVDDRLRSMYCEAIHRDGELLVSAEWFCQYLFDLHASCCDGVVYITDHFCALSANMADLIKDVLSGQEEENLNKFTWLQ